MMVANAAPKDSMRFLVQFLGWGLISVAVISAAAQIDVARNGQGDIAGFVITALFGLGGGLLVRKGRRMAARVALAPDGISVEQRVLTAARSYRGRVTAVSAAADGQITVDQARAELERLAKANACLMEVSPEGLVVFRFPEFE
jgi:hypothetical protein